MNLNQPIKAEVKAESTEVMKTVDEDRKYVIQATIVRYVCLLLPACMRLLRCGMQDNEGQKDDEASTSNPGSHLTNRTAIQAECLGHQEGNSALLPSVSFVSEPVCRR